MSLPLSMGLVLVLAAVTAGSLAVWVAIATRLRQGLAVIPAAAHRAVPWGALHVVLLLAGIILLQHLTWTAAGFDREMQLSDLTTAAKTRLTAYVSLASVVATGGGVALLVLAAGASRQDLGLPPSGRTLKRDILLGGLTFLAMAVPVYAIKLALVIWQYYFDGQSEQHPLVEMLGTKPDLHTVLVAVLAAVGVAPVFEEFVFRLLVQGWLEKLARRWLVGCGESADAVAAELNAGDGLGDGLPAPELAWAPANDARTRLVQVWPIALSAGLFALMHVGHGLDPIPLFVLAMGLGYLYQRTHRIAPSIVAHLLFNAFSLTILWLSMTGTTE